MGGWRARRMPAAAAAALALVLTGCGQIPSTARLEAVPEPQLPQGCLGAGLDLALGFGAYAVPLAGSTATFDELPSWESAALQLPPATSVSPGDGPFTLCSYVADHPTPFSTRGGDDEVVCVLVDPEGVATLLGIRMVATGVDAAACAPTSGG